MFLSTVDQSGFLSVDKMMNGVSPTGTFVKNKAATWNDSDVVPSGWTVELTEE